jgi:uncharacterized protein
MIASFSGKCLAAEQCEMIFERDVETRMRDGVVLRSDVYRPKADGKYPVLLLRTPYDKQDERDEAVFLAQHGYVAILQDVRGRYESDGEWYPFVNEANDGYDTIEWAAALAFSNGKVGMFGSSYEAAVQMLAAMAHPPHLAGVFSEVTAANYHEGWVYQGGALEQWMDESWTTRLSFETTHRRAQKENNPVQWMNKLPVSSYPVQNPANQRELAPYFFEWLAHPDFDAFWKKIAIDEHYGEINVPMMHVGAWYDIFLGGTLRNYLGLKAQASGETAKQGQRLIIGVGGHSGSGRKVGDVDFGPKLKTDDEETLLRWYDSVLKDVPLPAEFSKPVKIFVMGKNEWRTEDEWPLTRAKITPYYLQADKAANSLQGDGTLAPAFHGGTLHDALEYDPANPAPTVGGPLCCGGYLRGGPLDQRTVESRKDVLVYTTSAFQHDFEVTGPISADLYVSSSAVDTDFTAKLVDVWPNGFAQNLTEGILRMRYRNSKERSDLMNPGQPYKITIDMLATSNVFLAGHKLRLEVSSSNFPRFDRNLNTGGDQSHDTQMISAKNSVLHDKDHPSAINLPVIPQ